MSLKEINYEMRWLTLSWKQMNQLSTDVIRGAVCIPNSGHYQLLQYHWHLGDGDWTKWCNVLCERNEDG